jgi:hypothetical protein
MAKHDQIISAATNLLGISLVIITGLHVSRAAVNSYADEVACIAAVSLSISTFTSYLAIRAEPRESRFTDIADKFFLAGMVLLFAAVLVFAIGDR